VRLVIPESHSQTHCFNSASYLSGTACVLRNPFAETGCRLAWLTFMLSSHVFTHCFNSASYSQREYLCTEGSKMYLGYIYLYLPLLLSLVQAGLNNGSLVAELAKHGDYAFCPSSSMGFAGNWPSNQWPSIHCTAGIKQ